MKSGESTLRITSKYIEQLLVKTHLDVCFRIRLPNGHLPVQSQQQKHQNKVRNICKVIEKDTGQVRSSVVIANLPPPKKSYLALVSQLPTHIGKWPPVNSILQDITKL